MSKIVAALLILDLQLICRPIIALPDCNDKDIEFDYEPKDVTSVCRANEVATFSCQYSGTIVHPQWKINSTVYSSLNFHLPPDHYYSSNILTVTNLRPKNGSSYQCQIISSEGCAYKSRVAYLICEDIKVQCLPYYYYKTPMINYLTGINTTITHGDDQSDSYSVSYMDSDFDNRLCKSIDLPCEEAVCYNMFNTSTSSCPNTSNITVTVSAIEPDVTQYPMPDPIRIDAFNNFVRIFVTSTSLRCEFIDQSEDIEKFCEIKYGPGLNNLTLSSASTSDSNIIEIPLDSSSDSIYFIVVAGNRTSNVTVEGRSSAFCTIQRTSKLAMATIISAPFVAIYFYHKLFDII